MFLITKRVKKMNYKNILIQYKIQYINKMQVYLPIIINKSSSREFSDEDKHSRFYSNFAIEEYIKITNIYPEFDREDKTMIKIIEEYGNKISCINANLTIVYYDNQLKKYMYIDRDNGYETIEYNMDLLNNDLKNNYRVMLDSIYDVINNNTTTADDKILEINKIYKF